MKGLFKRLSILTASLAMVFGVGLVNNEKNAKAAESAYKTLTFPDDNKEANKVSSYTKTWIAKNGEDSYTIANANNNNWNNWTFIKFGSKNSASIGTISTDFSIDKLVTKVIVTIDKVTISNVNSTYLEVSSSSDFSTDLQKKTVSISKGDLEYAVETPLSNMYYRLTFDCKKSSNGIIQISKVSFYAKSDDRTLEKLTVSGTPTKTKYTNAESFDPKGLTIMATYTNGDEEDVTNEVKWSDLEVGMTSITGTFGGQTITIDGIIVSEDDTISFTNTTLEVLTESETDLSYTATGDSAITWESDKETIITVNDGKLKALSAGIATITATKGSEKATCKVLVTDHAGTETDPYSINDARNAIDFGKTNAAYVKGIVSEKSSLNTTYKNYDYVNIVDDANDATNFLQLFRFKESAKDGFTEDYINKGDILIATGNLTYFATKKVYELDAGCYLVERIANELTLDIMKKILKPNETFTLTATAGGEVTWLSSNPDVASVDNNGNVLAKKDGLATISANYNGASAECVVAVITNEGTRDNPYTINDARNAIEAGSTESVYVQGIVVSTNDYKSAGYYFKVNISDDGTSTNQLVLYNFYAGENKTKFTSDMIEKGGTILAYGALYKYNTDYELNVGCYLIEFTTAPENCTLTIVQSTTEYYKGENATFSYTFEDKKGNSYTNIDSVAWSSSNDEAVLIDENTGYAVLGLGSATITLTITVNGKQYTTSVDIKVVETPDYIVFIRSVDDIGEITLENYDSDAMKKAIQDANVYYELLETSDKEIEEVKTAKAKLDGILELRDAYTFIGDWNALRELGTGDGVEPDGSTKEYPDGGSICGYLRGEDYDQLKELLDKYDQMNDNQKAIIDAQKDGDTTIGNTISYIKAYLSIHGEPTSTGNQAKQNNLLSLNSSSNTMFVLVIGILGLASIAGYYFINKKRMLTK